MVFHLLRARGKRSPSFLNTTMNRLKNYLVYVIKNGETFMHAKLLGLAISYSSSNLLIHLVLVCNKPSSIPLPDTGDVYRMVAL